LLVDRVDLRRVNVGEFDYECGTGNELSVNRQRNDRRPAEIGKIVEFNTTPLGGPSGSPAHDGFVKLE
jgi:hypothetical protein